MIYLYKIYVNPICDHVPSQFITNPTCSSFSIYVSHRGLYLLEYFEVEMDGLIHGCIIIHVDCASFKQNNNNNNDFKSNYGVAGENSTHINFKTMILSVLIRMSCNGTTPHVPIITKYKTNT